MYINCLPSNNDSIEATYKALIKNAETRIINNISALILPFFGKLFP